MAALTMNGWLEKRGGQDASKGWKKRWCILSDNVIRYYKSDSDTAEAGTIFGEDIEDVQADQYESQKDSSKHGFIFRIVTKGRDYIFNAPASDNRDEWVKKIKSMVETNRSASPQVPDIRYATVEVFVNKGVRINGNIGSVLSAQLVTSNSKKITDERGCFIDNSIPHANILNLFTQHGWSLATAFQSSGIPPGSSSLLQSDTLVFTHPNF